MPSYVKQSWVDGVAGGTPLSAARLAYIEEGIAAAAKPPAVADAEIWVSGTGDDANTGRSPGEAKLTVNAAQAALPAGGGRINVADGIFTPFTISKAGTTVVGRGRNSSIPMTSGSGAAITVTATNVRISKFYIPITGTHSGSGVVVSAPDVTVERVEVDGSGATADFGFGVQVTAGADRAHIDRCKLTLKNGATNRGNEGVYVVDAADVIVERSKIHGARQRCIDVRSTTGLAEGARVINNRLSGSFLQAIVLWNGNAVVSDNRISGCERQGIFLTGDPQYLDATTTRTDGVMTLDSAVLNSATGTFVSGDVNRLIVVPGAGLGGSRLHARIAAYTSATQVTLSVTASTAVTAATYWYATEGNGGQTHYGTTVTSNVITDCLIGGIATEYDVIGCTISNNTCQRNGIALTKGTVDCVVSSNVVLNVTTGGYGSIIAPRDVLLPNARNSFVGNIIRNTVLTGTLSGIYIEDGPDSFVSDNRISGFATGVTVNQTYAAGTTITALNDISNCTAKLSGCVFPPVAAPGLKATHYYAPDGYSVTTHALVLNYIYATPLAVTFRSTLDRIGLEITTAAATSVVRLGIYRAGSDGLPNIRVVDAGTIDASTTGYKELTIAETLAPGLYFISAAAQVAACTVRAQAPPMWLGGSTSASVTAATRAPLAGPHAGAFPATFGAPTSYDFLIPRVLVRAA